MEKHMKFGRYHKMSDSVDMCLRTWVCEVDSVNIHDLDFIFDRYNQKEEKKFVYLYLLNINMRKMLC